MANGGGGWREHLISHGKASALPRDEINSQFLVPERGTQRAGQIEIPSSRFRVDVGRAASAVAPVNPKKPVADPDIAADPFEFLPGSRAVDVEIGAKPERIDLDAPLLLKASYRRKVDQRDHIVRLVHEMSVGRTNQCRRTAKCRHQLPKNI